ncbi:MAG: beta-lactamase family protein [Kangiellaceae bacterium]|nr:beta-lactamase family protein [Kangiellaceae bacterium]MCW9000305.1 beta-lactamase family protein [Kangiellaceae bacterium]
MHLTKFIKFLRFLPLMAINLYGLNVIANDSIEDKLQNVIRSETSYNDINELMQDHGVPGISLALIHDRRLYWTKGFGVKQASANKQTVASQKVDTETIFSVGSISKVGAAVVSLKQVDQGKIKLDADVNQYLTSWKVPQSRYNKVQPVTLKNILSHTAGFNVHGFADFQPGERIPKTLDILEGRYPAKNSEIELIFEPGSRYKYSGGGTTVQQMLLEDLLQKSFAELTQQHLFKPLGMNRSTYQNPLPKSLVNVAKAHDRRGKPRALPRGYEAMPEQAASGLWTTPTDLSKIIVSLMKSYDGDSNGFLSQNIVKKMMARVGPSEFGLGPVMVDKFTFQHGGSNDSYKAFFRGNLQTGNGYVIFTNGANGNALIKVLREVLEKLLNQKAAKLAP